MNNLGNYKKGQRREIVKLLLSCGVIPYSTFELWEDGKRLILRKARELEKEKIIEIKKRENRKYIVLKNYNKNSQLYLPYMPPNYGKIYQDEISLQRKYVVDKSMGINKSMRAMRASEIFILMYKANVRTCKEEKPDLRTDEEIDVDSACYYSSIEIKKWKPIKISDEINGQTRNTRLIGVLFAGGEVFCVYNIGDALIEWTQSGEEKIRWHVNKVASKKYLSIYSNSEDKNVDSSIFFAYKAETFIRIIRNEYGKKKKNNQTILLNVDFTYKHMYVLPYNNYGKHMIEIMSYQNWKELMKYMFFTNGENTNSDFFDIACDAYDNQKQEYIILFCIPDISKLKLFLRRAELEKNEKKFKIYCFDEQLPMIVPLTIYEGEKIAKIETVSFIQFFEEWEKQYG